MQLSELAAHLEALARKGTPTYYEEVCNRFGLPPLDGTWNAHPLSRAFETLDCEDADAQRPFRTVMVISKSEGMPGNGFFTSLERLKGVRARSPDKKLEVFAAQFRATTEYAW